MSDAESLMWRLEQDPHLSSTFAAVIVLDRAPDFEAFQRRLERTSRAITRLRQRVVAGPAGLPPVWVDDPDFDIGYHVRRIACPRAPGGGPGSLDQALAIAAHLVADPLDRSRPLWQFVVIEGLRRGRAAVVQKMHHTLTDGERGVELSLQYMDFTRDATEPPPLEPAAADDPPAANPLDTVRELVAGGLRVPIAVAREVRSLLAAPASIPDASAAAARTLKSLVAQLSDTSGARSPLWTERSLARRLVPLRADFAATKRAAQRLGGTLNTAFLTVAAHAAGDYHTELGAPVESLRASMAISTRTASSGANAFSLARLVAPTGDMPIADRFQRVAAAVAAARDASPTAGLDAIAALSAAVPTALLTRAVRQQSQTIDFATSNVRGSPVEMFIAGARIDAVHVLGPLVGVAFNLTLVSYVSSLDMGLHVDTAAIAEPDLLAQCFEQAFAELAAC